MDPVYYWDPEMNQRHEDLDGALFGSRIQDYASALSKETKGLNYCFTSIK